MQKSWPRDGILRVEIVRNASDDYSIIDSYEKEYSVTDLYEAYPEEFNVTSEWGEQNVNLTEKSLKERSNETVEEKPLTDEAGGTEGEDKADINSTLITLDLVFNTDEPKSNMQPFRETLSEFEMLAKVGELLKLTTDKVCYID